jgi:DNA-binding transcriptional LysR family regulator
VTASGVAPRRFSLDSLRYAATVARTGSFSRAAQLHGVTQPAMSGAIVRLESTLGERLFERSTRGATPTGFGAQILPLIDRALQGVDAVTAEAQRLARPPEEIIRLGVSPLINPDLVASAFRAVCTLPSPARHQLVLREANLDELVVALQAMELDIILVPSVGPIPLHEHRIVDEEPMTVVASSRAPGRPVELGELLADRLILVPDACGLTRFTHQLFESRGRAPRTYPGEPSSYRALEEWADLGLGTALLPISKLASPNAEHRLLLDEEHEVAIFYEAVWSPRSALAAELGALVDAITRRSRQPT